MVSYVAAPVLIAFAISALLGPVVIPFLRKLKVGQTEREELKSHLKKTGTPTMGGLIILAGILFTSLLFIKDYPKIIPILFLTVGFGAIGFLDDYLKVVLRRSDGLLAWQKMLLQIVVTGIFAYYILNYTDISLLMKIPFYKGQYLDLGVLAVPLMFFVVIGTVNGVNFTDGLDGLASSVTVLTATFFSVVAVGNASGIEPVTCAAVGALLGFLLFNVYPAKVFMGDTGSLALGAAVFALAILTKTEVVFVLLGLVYIVEALSVVIQVTSFKLFGRRVFKMSPLHHHFEMCGWSEVRIVRSFWAAAALFVLLGLLLLAIS